VSSPFKVKFAVAGMDIKPAGDMTANTGHHHLLVNAMPVKAGEVIPADEKHIHFGKGQTETELTLPPGNHLDHAVCQRPAPGLRPGHEQGNQNHRQVVTCAA
jgi:hypothetical protein